MWLNFSELETEMDDLQERLDDYGTIADRTDDDDTDEFSDPLDEDETERLAELKELYAQLGKSWPSDQGIPESEFKAYAEDAAECIYGDLGPLSNYIDWEMYADDLQADFFSSVEFDGETYYYRD